MPKDPRLILQASIPNKASAIAFDGGKGESVRLVLDLYSDDPADLLKLVQLRGERLFVTFVREEDVERLRREP